MWSFLCFNQFILIFQPSNGAKAHFPLNLQLKFLTHSHSHFTIYILFPLNWSIAYYSHCGCGRG